MTLSNPIKILIGVATLFVTLLPLILILVWLLMFLPLAMGDTFVDLPFQAFDAVFSLIFPIACILNICIYGLMAFYVTHAIKNQNASDVVRIIALLAVFLFPYFGMPFYYIVYILLPNTPSWALKSQPASIS
jgi:hypothetical protein